MVRTADHDARRQQLSRAALVVAVEEGLGRVTVARVAAEAGVSVGLVQHYFSTKELLVARAYADLLAATDQRVATVVEEGESARRSIREMATLALAELLPLTPPTAAECLVRAELRALAGRTPDLQAAARDHERALRARLARVVVNAQACGETDATADPVAVADALWAATDGASAASLVDPDFPAESVVAQACRRAFPLPCSRRAR